MGIAHQLAAAYKYDNVIPALNVLGAAQNIAVTPVAFATGAWLPVYSPIMRTRKLTIWNTDAANTIYYAFTNTNPQGTITLIADAVPVLKGVSDTVLWLNKTELSGPNLGALICYVWCPAATTGVPIFKFEQ